MKKIFCVIIAVMAVLVMSSSAFAIVYGKAGYEYEGYDESSAWEINSAAVLAQVRDDVNSGIELIRGGYFKLTKDIDLTSYTDWEPIGSKVRFNADPSFFNGHFDGDGHTIKLKISIVQIKEPEWWESYCALFGVVTDGSTIKNLNVEGSISYAGRAHTQRILMGGIAAYLCGGTIENCKFDGSVTGNQLNDDYPKIFIGGIAGYAGGYGGFYASRASDYYAIIKNCKVGSKSDTTITAKASTAYDLYAGGITAYFDDDKRSIISGNWVKVTTDAGAKGSTGGLFAGRSGFSGTLLSNTEVDPTEEPEQPSPNPEYSLEIKPETLAGGTAGTLYSQTLTAELTGAQVNVSWSSSSLPSWLTLNASTGALTGTPQTAGSYTFSVTAALGAFTGSRTYTITIEAGVSQPSTNSLVITTSSLPDGQAGTSYSESLKAEAFGMDVSSSTTWTLSSGSLPPNLSLDSSSGKISGTPLTAGSYTFTVTASWGTLSPGSKTFTITIAAGSSSNPNDAPEVDDSVKPSFKSVSMILEGQIGMNFFADLPFIDGVTYTPENCWTDFNIRGDTSPVPQPYDETFKNKTGKYYGFSCYIYAAQMADPIATTLHYGNNQSITLEYSPKKYLDSALASSSFTQIEHNLMAAIKNYGHYVQPMLSQENGWTIGEKYLFMDAHSELTSEEIDSAREAVKEFALVKELKGSGISKVTYSLTLGSETTLKIYITPASGYSGNVYAYVDNGTANMAVKDGSRYRVEISDIAAKNLGDFHTVRILMDAESSVKISALSYANTVLNANVSQIGKVDIETMKKAVTALYQYYKAAKEYFANK